MLLLALLCYDFFTLISEGFFSKKGKLLAYTLHILITQCMCMAWNSVYLAAAVTLDIYVMNLVGTACSIWSQRPSLPTQNGPCLHTLHLFLHSLHIRAAEIILGDFGVKLHHCQPIHYTYLLLSVCAWLGMQFIRLRRRRQIFMLRIWSAQHVAFGARGRHC